MTIRDFMKSGTFTVSVIVLAVLLLPFLAERFGDATGLFDFPATRWVKGMFGLGPKGGGQNRIDKLDLKLKQQRDDIAEFTKWAEGLSEAKISIVRPTLFQVDRADSNPVTTSRFSWRLRLLDGKLDMDETQIRKKLVLISDPEDNVSGKIVSVKLKLFDDGKKGFLATVDNVQGKGKIGLSYDGQPPVYYDVKLRRMWLVPVASCRSAMKGRYDSAVFFPGMEKGLPEGAIISPGEDKCGYRILSISDHCVWFEAFYGDDPLEDTLPHSIWPDFSRVDTMPPTPAPGRLVFGRNRCFWPQDAIKLPNSSSYLMVDGFLAGKAVVFRLLDSSMHPVCELLCVIVREKK